MHMMKGKVFFQLPAAAQRFRVISMEGQQRAVKEENVHFGLLRLKSD